MKEPKRFSLILVLLSSSLFLAVACARAPQDPGAAKGASERAAHEWIKTDPHLIARLGEVTKIEPGAVVWEKEKSNRVCFWRGPEHIRLVIYGVDGPQGKFEVRIMTQGRGDRAQVIYWAWSR